MAANDPARLKPLNLVDDRKPSPQAAEAREYVEAVLRDGRQSAAPPEGITALCDICLGDGVRVQATVCGWHHQQLGQRLADEERAAEGITALLERLIFDWRFEADAPPPAGLSEFMRAHWHGEALARRECADELAAALRAIGDSEK